MPNPPGLALLINKGIASKKGGGAGGGDDGGVADDMDPSIPDDGDGGDAEAMKQSAMTDFISAVHNKSATAAVSALEQLHDMFHMDDDTGGDGGDDTGGEPPEAA
jgi:hypothetical protein